MANETISNILVVVKGKDDGEIVLDKANEIARLSGAKLHVVRVVHEAFAELSIHDIEISQDLKTFLLRAEETMLEELIEPLKISGTEVESATIWHKSDWEAVLEVAGEVGADMIIKGTEHPVEGVMRTPSDWHLLRHAELPVMLLKPINWVKDAKILAALDVLDDDQQALNERVLLRADQLRSLLGGQLHVISVYPSVEHWVGPVTVIIDFDGVRRTVSRDIENRVKRLLDTLDIQVDKVHAVEGFTEVSIQQAVEELGAEILVMGTHRRSGTKGVVMGNTSEKILDTVKCDVEVQY